MYYNGIVLTFANFQDVDEENPLYPYVFCIYLQKKFK